MAKQIVIVGGGIAGLVAAYTLLKQGCDGDRPFAVTILEAQTVLGGQARAFAIPPTAPAGSPALHDEAPFTVEHGSHVFFQYYDTIIKLIDELRADEDVGATMPDLYRVPGWSIVDAYGNQTTLRQGDFFTTPYNVFPSILGIPWLPLIDRFQVGLGALSVLNRSYDEFGALDQMSSKELGLSSGYSELGVVAWNSASLGLTNLFIQEQSGALFCAKHKVLLGYPDGLAYRLPAGNLSELIAVPLQKKLAKLGATVILGATVSAISRIGGAARTVVDYCGPDGVATVEGDHVLLTVPPGAAAKLVPWVSAPWQKLDKVTPVLTIVVRLSAELQASTSGTELGLSREQWVFSVVSDLSKFWPEYQGLGKTVLRCEIGHADRLPAGFGTAESEILTLLQQDLERLYPEMVDRGITIEAYAIHPEDTLLYTRWARGEWSKKPAERDVGRGVFLAGDWTTKGTIGMEAAANSGIEAANHVLAAAHLPTVPFRDVPL